MNQENYASGLLLSENFTNAKMNLSIQSISDSAFVRIEHYYVYADGFKTPHPGLHISPERSW